jgi:homopolymeric O-antigen transport system permease protein
MLTTNIAELFERRDLLMNWTMREFKVRYSQSVLGAAWAILQPLSLMLIYTLIFTVFVEVPTDGVPYPVFAYVALLPWTFFSNAISNAIPSLVNQMSLLNKIYFPREILPLATILVAFVDFLVASSIFFVLLIIYHISLGPAIIIVPVAMALQILLAFGISLVGSAVNVFYRDIRFVVPLALQLLMYLSPIIYSTSSIPEHWRPIYFLNPLSVIIDTYRRAILFNEMPDWPYFILAVLVSLLITLLGYRYFKNAEKQFADLV